MVKGMPCPLLTPHLKPDSITLSYQKYLLDAHNWGMLIVFTGAHVFTNG